MTARDDWKVVVGDATEGLKTLERGSAQVVCCSPPYFQQRDYLVDGQIGMEETLEEFNEKLLVVFRECWRVLDDDGTLWVNIGDTFGANWTSLRSEGGAGFRNNARHRIRKPPPGTKRKDLLGVPWRLALALQSEGWYLRGDIIWRKTNACPENVTDRPNRTHEYVFFFSKKQKHYRFYPVALQERTKNAGSVWDIAPDRERGHPATMPVELAARCIVAGSEPEALIVDPFCGSGTTGVAALSLNRRFFGVDLSPRYVRLAEQRLCDTNLVMDF